MKGVISLKIISLSTIRRPLWTLQGNGRQVGLLMLCTETPLLGSLVLNNHLDQLNFRTYVPNILSTWRVTIAALLFFGEKFLFSFLITTHGPGTNFFLSGRGGQLFSYLSRDFGHSYLLNMFQVITLALRLF